MEVGSSSAYLWFGVYSHKFEIIPHLVQKVIIVPLVMGRDGDGVGDPGHDNGEVMLNCFNIFLPGDDVKLLDADLVDLVEHVDAGDVGPVTLHHVNKFI